MFDFTIWMVNWQRVRGTRCFELKLKDSGEIVAQGSQHIVCMDVRTQRPASPPEDTINNFRLDEPRVFPFERFPKVAPSETAFVSQRVVEWQDLDALEHVNNAMYVTYAEEAAALLLRHLDGVSILELFHGPTLAFKDFGARFLARTFGYLLRQRGDHATILVATSGDTGSAVAQAFAGLAAARVVLLYPAGRVSPLQELQLTAVPENVVSLRVEGTFDDCQAMVKRAFADPALAGVRLSSANSINIGRLLPQSVYYVYAYAKLAYAGMTEKAVFAVPSGNFGDMMGAVLAQQMGLPLRRVVIATNANDEVPRFLATGEYRKIEPSRVCLSNAMNVGHPSNLARLVDLYGGWMDETGTVKQPPDLARLQRDLYAVSISDEETRALILEAARHEFAHAGYAATSMENVARRGGNVARRDVRRGHRDGKWNCHVVS